MPKCSEPYRRCERSGLCKGKIFDGDLAKARTVSTLGLGALLKSIFSVSILLLSGAAIAAGQSGAPVIDPVKGVQNNASFIQGQPVAPGTFVAIFGSNFATSPALFDTIPLSNSLAGASVTFNNISAPIVYASSGQINAIVPWELPQTGGAQVVVTTAKGSSAPLTVSLTSAAPGLFDIVTDSTGVERPSAYNNSDGTLPMPVNVVPFPGVYKSRPAKIGVDAVILFCAGLGPVNNPPNDGSPGLGQPPYSLTQVTPTVLAGGVPAQVIFSGLSPQYPPFYQIAIILQPGTPTGDAVSLQIQMNGITTTDQLKIAVTQ